MTFRRWLVVVVLTLVAGVSGACTGHSPRPEPVPTTSTTKSAPGPVPTGSTATSPPDSGRKVMIIAEENEGYGRIIGAADAPYLNELAATYGIATDYDAGYPVACPSLAAYILLTSGSTAGICDDKDPKDHPLTVDNVFHQVAATGRQWRAYAESAPAACTLTGRTRYLVRHVPALYYVGERGNCHRWAVPLGATGAGALHDDVAAGTLPAYSFVTPDACDDMHGAPACLIGLVATGDRWLHSWLPAIMAAPDYRSGRLTVIVTWDEGTSASNHIPTLVIAPGCITSGPRRLSPTARPCASPRSNCACRCWAAPRPPRPSPRRSGSDRHPLSMKPASRSHR